MNAGELRHRVTFEREVRNRGDFGDGHHTWQAIASRVPASIEPLAGRELIAAQQVNSELTHRIATRWLSGVAKVRARDRITCGDRVFHITSVANIGERNIELQFMCIESE